MPFPLKNNPNNPMLFAKNAQIVLNKTVTKWIIVGSSVVDTISVIIVFVEPVNKKLNDPSWKIAFIMELKYISISLTWNVPPVFSNNKAPAYNTPKTNSLNPKA